MNTRDNLIRQSVVKAGEVMKQFEVAPKAKATENLHMDDLILNAVLAGAALGLVFAGESLVALDVLATNNSRQH